MLGPKRLVALRQPIDDVGDPGTAKSATIDTAHDVHCTRGGESTGQSASVPRRPADSALQALKAAKLPLTHTFIRYFGDAFLEAL
ncbi:hypothetical protein, partial [Mesorhizobium amorphae]|uniref:hypothetical protein n=1 Tax=Mesorhizobium amorphae TaxID=71433 RepID=UPI0024E16BC7